MNTRTVRSRLALAAGLTLLAAAGPGVAAAGASSTPPSLVRPSQELVALRGLHQARSRPDVGSMPVVRVAATRPITGTQTVLPVIGHAIDRAGAPWLRVRLPGRPNGLTGWIRQAGTLISVTGWHVVVEISTRRVVVYRDGRVVRALSAVVGKPSTPTPLGEHFVEEAVAMPADAAGAPFALALSARSEVLDEFAGGPGQVAIHGLANIGGVLGTAVSHGCVRVDTSAIRWLIAWIGPGTPVSIRR